VTTVGPDTFLIGGSSCLGWTSLAHHAADGNGRGRRDRRSNFYEIPDNLLEVGLAAMTKTEQPPTPQTRVAKLVKTAKRAKETAAKGVAKVR
jgi:hypothetical protein